MHGRNAETREKPGLKPSERYKYLYDEQELDEWAQCVLHMARQAEVVHVIFNNNYQSFAVTNAAQMATLLRG
jgi:uncharacterized protein YecE (DUF72 family)